MEGSREKTRELYAKELVQLAVKSWQQNTFVLAMFIFSGLINIAFGLPSRSIINQVFAMLAIDAGLGSVIIDPGDDHLQTIVKIAEMVLGRDRYCSNYTRAYREGKIVKIER